MVDRLDRSDLNYDNFNAYLAEHETLMRNHQGEFVAYSKGERLIITKTEERCYSEARKYHGSKNKRFR